MVAVGLQLVDDEKSGFVEDGSVEFGLVVGEGVVSTSHRGDRFVGVNVIQITQRVQNEFIVERETTESNEKRYVTGALAGSSGAP